MNARLARLASAAKVAPEERRLAGVVSGVLYAMGGLTLASLALLPGITHAHLVSLLVVASGAAAWGLCSLLLIGWESAPPWLIHVSSSAAFAVIVGAMASSGGATSPAWIYLLFVAVFAAYFYGPAIAATYLIACVATHAVVLLYDARALHGESLGQLVIAGPAYLALGGAIIAGKRLLWSLRSRAEQLAAEQGALRLIATAVVGGEPPERIYELVAREAARLLGGGAAGILQFDGPDSATVMGSWSDHVGGRYEPGRTIPVRAGSDVERARDQGVPVRIDAHPADSPVGRLGYESSIVGPIRVADAPWGVLAVAGAGSGRFTTEDEQQLMAFGDLLATAIISLEDRAKLAAQASSDPLTGLANHRTLQERLAAEVARAVRHDEPLSVAVIDIDHFKELNDNGGHDVGDEMLVSVADCLRSLARAEDTLGRVGGDEFAWVLPETGREQALLAVERVRRMISNTMPKRYRLTVSAGICDTSVTQDPAELIRLADGALYWSKAHGRDQCWIYDPAVISELSAQERAERLERSHALVGLRALARAIDAKDPSTQRHSERVSELVGRLARIAGWSAARTRLLNEAALVHDIGKVGISDELLRKNERLSMAERDQVRSHAELAARIVEDVLVPEQVEWIRTHHERPDGRGYPRGLSESEIPEGAALLAVADAWDVMTMSPRDRLPKSNEEALAECVRLVGSQFTAAAVASLIQLYAAGELDRIEAAAGTTLTAPD